MTIEYSTIMEECLNCHADYDPEISRADEPDDFCSTACEDEYQNRSREDEF